MTTMVNPPLSPSLPIISPIILYTSSTFRSPKCVYTWYFLHESDSFANSLYTHGSNHMFSCHFRVPKSLNRYFSSIQNPGRSTYCKKNTVFCQPCWPLQWILVVFCRTFPFYQNRLRKIYICFLAFGCFWSNRALSKNAFPTAKINTFCRRSASRPSEISKY